MAFGHICDFSMFIISNSSSCFYDFHKNIKNHVSEHTLSCVFTHILAYPKIMIFDLEKLFSHFMKKRNVSITFLRVDVFPPFIFTTKINIKI